MLALIGLAGWLLQFDWIVSSCLSTGLDCDFFVFVFVFFCPLVWFVEMGIRRQSAAFI